MFMVMVSPTATVCAGIAPSATGGRLGTVTPNSCMAARPSVSVAVTVTVASPLATAVIVTVLSDTVTLATLVSDVAASWASASPSGSLK